LSVGAVHALIWRAARGLPDAPAARQVVLGLLAPLALNVACAAAAEAVCEHYKLPDADCAQLWYAASAVTATRAPCLHCRRLTCSTRKHGTQETVARWHGRCGTLPACTAAALVSVSTMCGGSDSLQAPPAANPSPCALVRRYGAFALAMVLSLASAIPIVFVCRLPECARLGRAAAA
jgi:hypothetical protein